MNKFIQEIDIMDAYRIHHMGTAIYTLFLNVQRILTKIDPIIINNTNFIQFQIMCNSKRVMYQNVHCSSIYNSQDMEAT